jgi:diacylglycerol kinase
MPRSSSSFTAAGRAMSFVYAFRGLLCLVRTQHNARIHLFVSVLLVGAGIYVGLNWGEWCWLATSIVSVWGAEAFNTAFEFLADAVSPDFHPLVRDAKDVSAAAVLMVSVVATANIALIFVPHLTVMFGVVPKSVS